MIEKRTPLIIGASLGILSGIFLIFISPFEIGTDFKAYYYAVRSFLAGNDFYAAAPPNHPDYHFLYLPATLLWFLPFGLLPEWWMAYLLMVTISLGAAVAYSRTLIEFIEQYGMSIPWADKVLIAAFLILSTFAIPNLLQGQVNLLLGIAVGTGFILQLTEKSRKAGILIGMAATLKLYPSVLGVWFIYKRDWEALAAAIGVGILHIFVSIVVFGLDKTKEFFFEILPHRLSMGSSGGVSPDISLVTIRRPLSVLLGLEGNLLSVVALSTGGLIIAYTFWAVEDDLVKILGLVVAVIIAFPSYFIYLPLLLFPVVPLLYLEGDWLFAVGLGLLTATFTTEHVASILGFAPDAIANPLLAISTSILSIVTPPLIGALLLLAWIWLRISNQKQEMQDPKELLG